MIQSLYSHSITAQKEYILTNVFMPAAPGGLMCSSITVLLNVRAIRRNGVVVLLLLGYLGVRRPSRKLAAKSLHLEMRNKMKKKRTCF